MFIGCLPSVSTSLVRSTVDLRSVSVVSDYCPLDLYSCEPARVTRAVASLLATPRNNLKLFAHSPDGSTQVVCSCKVRLEVRLSPACLPMASQSTDRAPALLVLSLWM